MKSQNTQSSPFLNALFAASCLLPVDACAQASTRGPTSGDIIDAARNDAKQDQSIEQQRQSKERERALNAATVRSDTPGSTTHPLLPLETPCFQITWLNLEVPPALPDTVRAQGRSALPLDPFSFAQGWLDRYAGQCIGKQGLDVIVKGLSQRILRHGYITSRVLLSEQDLSSGRLKLTLVPGVISTIRFSDPDTRGTWKSAFPTRPGDLLNLRDLEQGLEQMKRVASQDITMQIESTDIPGESDIVITANRVKPWTLVTSVDNAGTRATGKAQANVSVGIDNPFGLNDIFNIGASHDLALGDKRLGSHGWNAFYAIPWGYWTATLSAYTSTYYQQIAGVNQTFVSSGNSKAFEIKLQRVLSRSQNDVFGMRVRLSRRFGRSFIEDTEIPLQRRNITFVEFALTDRHYGGRSQFDGMLAYRQGVGAFGAQADAYAALGGATYRYSMTLLDANLSIPFVIMQLPARYVTTFHGQSTGNALYYIDNVSIGSRYTVRGFDGETMLAATRGFYWRNELQIPIGQTGHMGYAGVDYGHVWGKQPVVLKGTQLAGMVFGVRGNVGARHGRLAYDLFAGTPILKPPGFPTARVTVGFQLTNQF